MKAYSDMGKIQYILSVLIMVTLLLACSAEKEDIQFPSGTDEIRFTFALPDDGRVATRAKTTFRSGDDIYISAEVSNSENSETEVKSTILTYTNGSWKPKSGKVLTWPANAVKAIFRAYYIPSVTNDNGDSYTVPLSMEESGSSVSIPLGHFKEATDDPFMARVVDIPVNGVVSFQFAHMTSKLTVTGLKYGKTKKVLFYNENTDYQFNNRINFSYSETEGFKHSFSSDGTNRIMQDEFVANNNTSSQVVFFLNVDADAWEEYSATFRLTQYGEKNEEEPDAEREVLVDTTLGDKKLYSMQRGRAYSIYFLTGQTNNEFIEEENWYKEPTNEVKFTTEQQIKDYFASFNGELNEDLDFNFIELTDGVIPFSLLSTKAISLSRSFNGNHHTIRNINVKNGLFDAIPSDVTIQNLRLENVKVEAVGVSAAGLLAPVNYGTISNLRISGNNSMGTDNVPYAGGLVGLNLGVIKDVRIEGTLIMDYYADTDIVLDENNLLAAGGLVGANGLTAEGSATIENSEVVSASIMTVAATLNREVCIGGFAGINAIGKTIHGTVAESGKTGRRSTTNMLVDATHVNASTCHVGGFVGKNRGKLSRCDASGDVKGGVITDAGGRNSVAGFMGYTTSGTEIVNANKAAVNNCSASGYVYENGMNTGDAIVYIGGFGGFSQIDLYSCSSVGKISLAGNSSKRSAGGLLGLFSASETITNSFSMTTAVNGGTLKFGGAESAKITNCHYGGYMVINEDGSLGETVTEALLNAARGSNTEWTSNSSFFGGAPYLLK